LKNAVDLKSHFMPLHFVTTLRGISMSQFPPKGLSWEFFIQFLNEIIGLFCLAMRDYGLPTVCTAQVPFLVNFVMLLHLVSSTKVHLSWPTAPQNYTVAAYKLLEFLFLLYTWWFYCLKSTVPGAEIVDAGPPASPPQFE
jgi:hypothetical protein